MSLITEEQFPEFIDTYPEMEQCYDFEDDDDDEWDRTLSRAMKSDNFDAYMSQFLGEVY